MRGRAAAAEHALLRASTRLVAQRRARAAEARIVAPFGCRSSREAQLEAGALLRMESGAPPDGLGVSREG
jgi:hypothetical protein